MPVKLTQEEFIVRAKKVHGEKYDYSKVLYTKVHSKVTIICKVHGEFNQTANSHLHGTECFKCGHRKKGISKTLTTEKFITQSMNIHGSRYDYSLVKYYRHNIPVKIICTVHGIFEQLPVVHTTNHGCPKCAVGVITEQLTLTTNEFINRAKNIHGSRYDYSLVRYIRTNIPITIICKVHGEFKQKPNYHLTGNGCQKCGGSLKSTTEIFINEAIKIHGNKYEYSLVNYINSKTPVTIICKVHGEFKQKPITHLLKCGCNKCGYDTTSRNIRKSLESFIIDSNITHNNFYDYSKSIYINAHKKVIIICPKHGEFLQCPGNHTFGQGCPICARELLRLGCINWKYFILYPNRTITPAIFYVLKFTHNITGHTFIKVGITTNSIRDRYYDAQYKVYSYDILFTYSGNLLQVFELEQYIINKFDRDFTVNNFAGKTECLMISQQHNIIEEVQCRLEKV